MVEVRGIEVCLWRFITTGDDVITSRMTHNSGVPADWSVDEICDWVEVRWGDMLNSGWEFGFKFVESK